MPTLITQELQRDIFLHPAKNGKIIEIDRMSFLVSPTLQTKRY